ncbi:MAG: hypothetical protein IPL32_20570 [Chloracidobacterium sp.]|nr:hypothetical protein [Chloracidobacterium sp.]
MRTAFTGVMVDRYDTSDTNQKWESGTRVWTIWMPDQATLSETVNT